MSIRTGHSLAPDPARAAAELYEEITQPSPALTLFFCSSRYDLPRLAAAINATFAGTPVIGCTTAGEIGPRGYRDESLVGVSFSSAAFAVSTAHLAGLAQLGDRGMLDAVRGLRRGAGGYGRSFAFMLVDGLRGHEERLGHACQTALGEVPLVGGSAGDDQRFAATHVFWGGEFRRDSAVVAVMTTALPFKVFQSHHFVSGSEPLIVTEADASRRLVREINGRPAAAEYARAAGVPLTALTPQLFAAVPLVVRLNGRHYVRSIRELHADGSLTLYCAIERGVALRVARSLDMTRTRGATSREIREAIGAPQLTLLFDCIHCRLDARRQGTMDALNDGALASRALGFSTYGEQFMGVHLNHTTTGVAIGTSEGDPHV